MTATKDKPSGMSKHQSNSTRRVKARPVKAARPAQHTQKYCPCLAEWSDGGWLLAKDAFDVVIREEKTKYSPDGLPVFRIVVDPRFTKEAAQMISCLITFAPQLWRALRDVLPNVLNDHCTDGVEKFAKYWELLWAAGEMRPYEYPRENSMDDSCERFNNVPGIRSKTKAEQDRIFKVIESNPL
jgi:hypothetical protein